MIRPVFFALAFVAALAGRLLRAAWSVATGDPAGPLELTATAVHADAAYQPWLARIARLLL